MHLNATWRSRAAGWALCRAGEGLVHPPSTVLCWCFFGDAAQKEVSLTSSVQCVVHHQHLLPGPEFNEDGNHSIHPSSPVQSINIICRVPGSQIKSFPITWYLILVLNWGCWKLNLGLLHAYRVLCCWAPNPSPSHSVCPMHDYSEVSATVPSGSYSRESARSTAA